MPDDIILHPIGSVIRDEHVTLQIDERYRPALAHLSDFSHVIVLWWVTGHDKPESREITVPAWFDGWPEWLPDEGLGP